MASGEVPFGVTVYNHNAEKLKVKGAPVDWYAIQPAAVRTNGAKGEVTPASPIVLDESDKWQKLFDEIFKRQGR